MTDPTLYLFDGHNLLHAGRFRDPEELVDRLASFLALRGARGVAVFDGPGRDRSLGPLQVRHAPHADSLIERLAAEHRRRERVCVVSSDAAVCNAAGPEVETRSSSSLLDDLVSPSYRERAPSSVADRLDEDTRAALERLRRGQSRT